MKLPPLIQVPATKELMLAISRAVDEEPSNVELLSLRAQLMIALMKQGIEEGASKFIADHLGGAA